MIKLFSNKKFIGFFIILFFISLFLFPLNLKAQEDSEELIPDEFLVQFKGSEKIHKINNDCQFSLKKWSEILSQSFALERIEPNYSFQISFLPDDPYYSQQWYLEKIKAPQAWDLVKGGDEDVVIAILDTGVDIDHPDLKNNIWENVYETSGDGIDNDNNGYIDDINGWDFIRKSSNPRPKFDEDYNEGGIHHGTLVAGIAAAVGNNSEGTTGLAWNTKIMPLRVLNSEGSGSVEHVIQAVNYAVNNGADIINLSFVGTDKSYFLLQALKKAWEKGVVVVAAAGNETEKDPVNLNESPNYPICLDEDDENFILGVAAVNNLDQKALFSDYGSRCVDVSAPGTRIFGPLVYNPHYDFKEYYGGYWSGTSLAAPLVSGLAALIKSVNPLFSHKQIQDFILAMADNVDLLNPGLNGHLGWGRINAYQSVDYARAHLGANSKSHYIITGAGPGGGPHVRIFDSVGLPVSGFFAYGEDFRGGVKVAAGDINGNGQDEIITGAGPGGGPHVRAFDLWGQPQAGFFAYGEDFRGGVEVAVGDVDGDGRADIITGAGPGGGPHVRVFDYQGNLKSHFFAYGEDFRGGVKVAVGDVDGDGKNEIITGAGPGGGPHVRVFDYQGNLKFHFFAFNKDFRGGVEVAVGDVDGDGDGQGDIIVSVSSGASSYVRVFDSEFLLLKLQFLTYPKDFYYGNKIAVADFDQDNQVEIIIGPGNNYEPEIKIFDSSGQPLSQFYSYSRHFKGGVEVATMKAY